MSTASAKCHQFQVQPVQSAKCRQLYSSKVRPAQSAPSADIIQHKMQLQPKEMPKTECSASGANGILRSPPHWNSSSELSSVVFSVNPPPLVPPEFACLGDVCPFLQWPRRPPPPFF